MLGLGAEADGLTGARARRIVADIDRAVDVVGLTVAEFIPRQVMHLQQVVEGFSLTDNSREWPPAQRTSSRHGKRAAPGTQQFHPLHLPVRRRVHCCDGVGSPPSGDRTRAARGERDD